jgi:hypothetical protein
LREILHMTAIGQVGRAMIKVARQGYPKAVLESADINRSNRHTH